MRRPIIAGNWKLHQTMAQIREFCAEITGPAARHLAGADVVIAPTALGLMETVRLLSGSGIGVAAQNCYWEASGAYTGEISPELIADAGAGYVLIGHSERRALFGDTDNTVRRRVLAAQRAGLVPIYCIGETLEEREAGQVQAVLERQLTFGLEGIDVPDPNRFVVAYEPVWAIGTGRSAGPEDAHQAHSFVRQVLGGLFGAQGAGGIRVLYGGSVKPENSAALCSSIEVDGVLVGGASLKADSFAGIMEGVASSKAPGLVGAGG